jgi:hypothetical protein
MPNGPHNFVMQIQPEWELYFDYAVYTCVHVSSLRPGCTLNALQFWRCRFVLDFESREYGITVRAYFISAAWLHIECIAVLATQQIRPRLRVPQVKNYRACIFHLRGLAAH